VLISDPDTTILSEGGIKQISDLEWVLFEFQQSGMDALCPRITVKEENWLTRIQPLNTVAASPSAVKALPITASIPASVCTGERRWPASWRTTACQFMRGSQNSFILLGRGGRILL